MEITDFTIRIILLSIPGLISYLIINKLTEAKKDNLILDITKIIIYSFINYSIYAVFYTIAYYVIPNNWDAKTTFLDCLTNTEIPISWVEIIITSFISIFTSCIIARILNISWFHKTAQQLHITKKFSDADVWGYLFNSKDNFYIVIRDIKNNLTYQGYPNAFSNTNNQSEVLLVNVKVYRYDDGEFLYDCDSMYYKFNSDSISFEIQLLEEKKMTSNKNIKINQGYEKKGGINPTTPSKRPPAPPAPKPPKK